MQQSLLEVDLLVIPMDHRNHRRATVMVGDHHILRKGRDAVVHGLALVRNGKGLGKGTNGVEAGIDRNGIPGSRH
jgi:hypothetical protein